MEKKLDTKSVLLVVTGYVLWGVQSLYWALLDEFDSMFLLGCRILWGAVLLLLLLWAQGRLQALFAVFRDKKRMKYLLPATLFLLADWGIYIWAVQAGHVLDVSLGYYMTPLVVFALSIFLFKERCGKLQLAAMGLAVAGALVSLLFYGRFPLVSFLLSFAFAIYGALKKYADIEPVISICAECLLMSPLALIYILLFGRGAGGLATVTLGSQVLLILAGVVTALPMILYSVGVRKLPFLMLGFCQYISPTIGIFCGLFLGETLTQEKLVTFLFIWAGLILFSVDTVRQERKRRAQISDENCEASGADQAG